MREWVTASAGRGAKSVGRADGGGVRLPRRHHAVRRRRHPGIMDAVSSPLNLPGWRHVYSGKVRDLYRPADPSTGSPCARAPAEVRRDRRRRGGPDARRRERPRQRVRPRALARHPGQGRAAHDPQPVVVRPARGRRRRPPHPEPPARRPRARRRRRAAQPHPRRGRGSRDGREEPRHAAHRVRRARIPDRQRVGGVPRERHGLRHPAARPGCRTATGCPSRSTPRRSRRRWASTTRTSPTSAPSSSSAPRPPRPCATCPSRSTPGRPRPRRRTA